MDLLFPSRETFMVAPEIYLPISSVLVSLVPLVTEMVAGFFSSASSRSRPRVLFTLSLAPDIYTLLPPVVLSLKVI